MTSEEEAIALDDFEAVFRAYFPAVYRFIVRRVGMTLAEDLAAETFAIAYRKRGAFRAELGTVRSWLYGIAMNTLRNHWRAEQRGFERDAGTLPPAITLEVSEAVDQRLAAAALAPVIASALASLSRQQREVLLLYAWAELTQEEISAALGLSPGAVRSRLFRARAALRARLGEFDYEEWAFEGHEDD